jgi:hypothetical protein
MSVFVVSGFADGTAPLTCAVTSCEIGILPDLCGTCGGDNSTCLGCDNVPKSGKTFDACGKCLRPDSANYTTDATKCPADPNNGGGGSSSGSEVGGKSFPVGVVIAVVVVACILIGGGVYIYMRRREARMKDDIDQLLRQYLPLDGPVTAMPDKRIVDRRSLMSDDEHAGLTNIQSTSV